MAKEGREGSVPELVKLYYRIGEVSRIVGVAPHVLRYWETEFRTIRPQKSTRGQRVYSRRDVAKLLHVKDLLRNQGFTIAGAKKRLRPLSASVDATKPASPDHVSPAPADVAAASRAADGGVDINADRGGRRPGPNAESSENTVATVPLGAAVSETASDAKAMRRALVGLRKDLVAWLSELCESETAGRPAEDKQ